ncbi:hypothetical protein NQZ68_016148 [Dissostichus eleginoides]|nr:hypothetical protein NQZ68_016146 [Dissostichus eleginoides]KAI9542844.1 hypothetical protein NQZ68_016148 [Dissostichus eleginoides]
MRPKASLPLRRRQDGDMCPAPVTSPALIGRLSDLVSVPVQSLGRGEGGGFSKREAVKQVSRLPATHGECHSFSELKPTGPLCEGEALPSDTDNSTPVQLQVLCGQDIR